MSDSRCGLSSSRKQVALERKSLKMNKRIEKMKELIKVFAVVAIIVVAGINVYTAQKIEVLSDIAMANVEALAQYEAGSDMCSSYYGYAVSKKIEGTSQVWTHYGYGLDRVTTYTEVGCIASGRGTLWGNPNFSMETPSSELVPCTGLCEYPQ